MFRQSTEEVHGGAACHCHTGSVWINAMKNKPCNVGFGKGGSKSHLWWGVQPPPHPLPAPHWLRGWSQVYSVCSNDRIFGIRTLELQWRKTESFRDGTSRPILHRPIGLQRNTNRNLLNGVNSSSSSHHHVLYLSFIVIFYFEWGSMAHKHKTEDGEQTGMHRIYRQIL